MKETEIHHVGVIEWAIIEENRFYALNTKSVYMDDIFNISV